MNDENWITLTEDEVREAFDEGEVIKEYAGKHDCTIKTVVFKKDNKFYEVAVDVSYNNGIQVYGDTNAVEVEQVEEVVKVWKTVKKK